jgi:hypothetical protein
MHIQPYENGGSGDASNILYRPDGINSIIGSRPMMTAEIAEAEPFTPGVAASVTPGVKGDLAKVTGDSLETGGLGGVLGGGHRHGPPLGGPWHRAAAMRAGPSWLAKVEAQTVQAMLGANPLTRAASAWWHPMWCCC